MLKMPVNGVPWSLIKKCLKPPSILSTKVPQVLDCVECLECLKWLECPNVLCTRMLERLQNAYGMPTECPDGTKFWIFICPNE